MSHGERIRSMPRTIEVTELALRDAHQSLLATRMAIEDMIPICEDLDNAGYWSLECWGGATFDACIRFLNEDPWERLRTFRKLLPNSRLQMLLRGQNLLGYRHYADEVVERFVDKAANAGIDVFRVFDALNDLRNLRTSIAAVKKSGKHAQGTISYTTSPVHTIDAFVVMAEQLRQMGSDSICIKDMAGLLKPQAAYDLVKGIKTKCGADTLVHVHSRVHVDQRVCAALRLNALNQVIGSLRFQQSSHIFNANRVAAHLPELFRHDDESVDSMHRARRVRDRSLRMLAALLHGRDAGAKVAQVVEGIEDPEDVDTGVRRFVYKALHHFIRIVAVSQQVLAAQQHLEA